jgi:hypothetical protein
MTVGKPWAAAVLRALTKAPMVPLPANATAAQRKARAQFDEIRARVLETREQEAGRK